MLKEKKMFFLVSATHHINVKLFIYYHDIFSFQLPVFGVFASHKCCSLFLLHWFISQRPHGGASSLNQFHPRHPMHQCPPDGQEKHYLIPSFHSSR